MFLTSAELSHKQLHLRYKTPADTNTNVTASLPVFFKLKVANKSQSEVVNSPVRFSGGSLYVFLPDLKKTNQLL